MKSTTESSQHGEEQHPGDALGDSLERVNTLLSAIGAMFEPGRESFAVNAVYIMHSLLAAQGLVVNAQTSLNDLLSQMPFGQATAGSSGFAEEGASALMPEATIKPAVMVEEDEEPIPYTPFSSSRFADDMTASASNTEFAEILPDRVTSAESRSDKSASSEAFAQSYLELLRKLTAAEIFAAEQQALSPPGTQHQLLPLLRSLREDFQKIHSAA